MSDYTPTTDRVREAYARGVEFRTLEQTRAEFDRWLAQHDAEVRTAVLPLAQAAALEEAADEMYGDKRASGPFAHPLSVMTWLRERAARLREGSTS